MLLDFIIQRESYCNIQIKIVYLNSNIQFLTSVFNFFFSYHLKKQLKKNQYQMIFFAFYFFLSSARVAHDPLTEPNFPVIQNQGFTPELNKSFVRLPERAKGVVRDALYQLSLNSAGLAIYFKTDSSDIWVDFSVSGDLSMPHMAETGVSGVDLLGKNETGQWSSLLSSFSFSAQNKKVSYAFNGIRKSSDKDGFEYRLYLPLYNTISDLVISVNDGTSFKWIEKDCSKPIVMYGTSIAQGCCSSRPISSWAGIVQRHFDMPLLNFGFSGNGLLEEQVISFIIENDAALYILDCIPNLASYAKDTIKNLLINAVHQIRKIRPNVPILVVDFAGYSYQEVNPAGWNRVVNSNSAQKEGYDQLIDEGVQKLYYLTREEIGLTKDSWTDWIHPNNYGMKIYAQAYIKKIHEILDVSEK